MRSYALCTPMGFVGSLPLFIASPRILVWDLRANRKQPPLAALLAETDSERFLWRILPHAARTFALSILCLSRPAAKACAVAYLQCRILDTLEDLMADPVERDAVLRHAATRLQRGEQVLPVVHWLQQDERDAVHRLLVAQAQRVDTVLRTLPTREQLLVHQLVQTMAVGMVRAAQLRTPAGALRDDEALLDYCDTVIGEPLRFCARLFLGSRRDGAQRLAQADPHIRRAAGFLQIANITRDIEKDLARGVRHAIEMDAVAAGDSSEAMRAAAAAARVRLTRLAFACADEFDAAVAAVAPRRWSPTGLAARVLRRITLRHHQRILCR